MTQPLSLSDFEEDIRPTTILVVDDDATVCRTINVFLKSRNYQVRTANDGQTALELLEQEAFDLVFLDLLLPDIPGIKLLKTIRKRFTPLSLPVIMLTASEDTTDIVVCLEAGANDYMVKPGILPVMIARIETQLALKSMNDELLHHKEDLARRALNSEVAYEIAKGNLETEMDERMEAEKALVISEHRFKELYDNTPAVYLRLDERGRIVSINKFGAFLLGYHRKDLLKKSVYDLYHPEDYELARQYIQETIDDPGRLHRWELRKIKKDGQPILLRETVRLVEEIDGNKIVLMVCVDITTSNKSEITIQ